MSRIGRLPIAIPSGVDVLLDGRQVDVKGPKGSLTLTVAEPITIEKQEDGQLARTLISNMIQGVTEGYEKKLEIVGVGYRVIFKGPQQLEFALGFSHPVIVNAPEGITFVVEAPTRFSVQGIDKQLVGETAANIRKIRKPEPYKGKGVRYAGDQVRRKAGKAGK